eukprot:g13220.t1
MLAAATQPSEKFPVRTRDRTGATRLRSPKTVAAVAAAAATQPWERETNRTVATKATLSNKGSGDGGHNVVGILDSPAERELFNMGDYAEFLYNPAKDDDWHKVEITGSEERADDRLIDRVANAGPVSQSPGGGANGPFA